MLYIEDDPVSIAAVEKFMRTREGVELLTAMDGDHGLAKAREEAPELVILDLGLPDRTGLEVLQQLRAEPQTKEIPVIVLTADTDRKQEASLMEAGALAYLTKPMDEELMLALIDEVLGD